MTFTISLIDALLILLAVLAIVLLYKLIVLVHNLIPSAKSLSKIAEDVEHITEAAKNGAADAQKIVSGITSSLNNISNIFRGNQSSIAAMTNLTNALANIAALAKKKKK
ncbi:MAG: hypothetical protein EOM59_13920 [Clostridia bacterium]|nr:hypothetical protein [Clostridia bacterium]